MKKSNPSDVFGGSIIRNMSIAEQVAATFRNKIINGEFEPGLGLNEIEMAKAVGVSKNTLREAFMILGGEGLLIKNINKGTNVVLFSKDDIREIYSLRIAIEKLSAELCVKKGTIPIDEMQKQAELLRLLAADGKMTEFKEFEENDLLFHELIVKASGNGRVIQVWNNLKSQIQVLLFSQLKSYPTNAIQNPDTSHEYILKLLINKDFVAAQEVLERHIESGMNNSLCISKYK